MAFVDQLRGLMRQRGMKAVELARSTGLSEAAVSDYLKGKKEPRGRQSIAIAKALHVSLDVLWETGFGTDAEDRRGYAGGIAERYCLLNGEYQTIVDHLIDQLLKVQEK